MAAAEASAARELRARRELEGRLAAADGEHAQLRTGLRELKDQLAAAQDILVLLFN